MNKKLKVRMLIYKIKVKLGFKTWHHFRCPKCGGMWELKTMYKQPKKCPCGSKTYKITESEFDDRMEGVYKE